MVSVERLATRVKASGDSPWKGKRKPASLPHTGMNAVRRRKIRLKEKKAVRRVGIKCNLSIYFFADDALLVKAPRLGIPVIAEYTAMRFLSLRRINE